MDQKPLHILFLCSWYPNPESNTNGIFIRRHAQALALSHHVTVLFVKSVNANSESYTEKRDGNLKEILFFYPKSKFRVPVFGNFFKFLKFKSQYEKQMDALQSTFDIIHLNTIFPAAIPAFYALKKNPKALFFITEHWSGYYPEDGSYKGFVMKYYTKKIAAKAKALFVISDKLKEAMQSNSLLGPYKLINNVVDTSIFKPKANDSGISQTLKILHVSSLVEREKNISGIINIAEKLKQQGVDFTLTIIGENLNERINHQSLAYQKLNDSDIKFVGYKQAYEIADYMNESDVFLLFSHYEGMPVVLLESMSCGLPVITTQVGQVNKIVNSEMGIILQSDDIDACVEILRQFKRAHFLNAEIMHQEIKKLYSYESVCQALTTYYTSKELSYG
jgi:glycosyltransferase involved in cell wall biosynthesis